MIKYLQKPFDKAFVTVVEELYGTREKHGKFTKKKELLGKLGIIDSNYSAIKKKERGVPSEKYSAIKDYLKKEFSVNPMFLDTNKGQIFLEPGNKDSNPTSADLMMKDLSNCEEKLQEKERFIAFQEKTINMMKATIESQQRTIDNLTNKK